MPKSKPTIIPLHDRILLDAPPRSATPKEIIKDGIIVPAMASNATRADLEETHAVFPVISVGGACKLVRAGQRVVVRKPQCFVVKIDEVEHVMVREGDVVAVVP